ncbi:MAG: hypothetical protein ACREBW_04475 [Candidatus Micrarchaeaceae archaeon]
MNTRIARGFLWGMVATVAMTVTHLSIWTAEGQLTIHAMATHMMPAIIITKMFGPGLPVSTHLVLAAVIHLGYGGFWGAMLFALTPRVTFWKGVAVGAFLYLGSHIFMAPLLGGRITLFSWFSISTHFTYGAALGLLGGWQDRVTEATRVGMKKMEMQAGPAK